MSDFFYKMRFKKGIIAFSMVDVFGITQDLIGLNNCFDRQKEMRIKLKIRIRGGC
jgi:hypothetical protein